MDPTSPAPIKRTCILVLGMHRSGTSALTRVLSLLGAALPKNLMPPAPANNEMGFWEPIQLAILHDQMLAEAGSSWDDWRKLDLAAQLPTDRLDHYMSEIRRLLEEEYGDAPLIVLKEPRICRFALQFIATLAEAGIETRVVLPIRNPVEVARSLQLRGGGMLDTDAALLWLRHVLDAEAATRGLPRAFVSYDTLLDDWKSTITRISGSVSIDWPFQADDIVAQVASFLDPAHRHHTHSRDEVLLNPVMRGWVSDAYHALQVLEDNPALVSACGELDRIRGELDHVAPILGLHADALRAANATAIESLRGALDERDAKLADANHKAETLAAQLAERDAALAEKNDILQKKDDHIRSSIAKIERLDQALRAKAAEVDSILASTSWKLLARPRRIVTSMRAARHNGHFIIREFLGAPRQVFKQLRLARSLIKSIAEEGMHFTWSRVLAKTMSSTARFRSDRIRGTRQNASRVRSDDLRYDSWLRFNSMTEEQATRLRTEFAARERSLPTISVLMPVYNAPIEYLDAAIESVLNQIYPGWQLCIVDDASTQDSTRRRLDYWRQQDQRIRFERLSQNQNISVATNAAAKMATGEFLAFLDQDDLLTPDALAEIAISLADEPLTDYIYSDDDKIDARGRRYAPQFKPDWSPVLLLSFMYMSHIKVVRRSLYERLGGFRKGFEGSQDYDFALRMSELARKIVHLPKVLYHWRATPGSTADSGDAKPASFEAGRKAVEEALLRRGFPATVARPDWAVRSKSGVFEPQFSDTGPSVAIIIPTKNRHDLLRVCINSLKQTTYTNYRVYVIDNESDDPATIAYLNSGEFDVLHIANPPGTGFSYAHINNEAVRRVEADYVLLLNNDTEVRTPRWLSQMVGYAAMPSVGAVGARLLFGDETLQHAGIAHGYYSGMAGPTFRNLPSWNQGYMGLANVARECSAVTAACLLVKRSMYLEHGGLDEQNFAVAYNDVDLCYRLIDAGYSCIYCPGAELFHFEGKSRGHADNPREIAAFRRRYALRSDPWLSRNLSRDNEHFEVRPYHLPVRDKRAVRVAMFSHNLNLEGAPNSLLEMVSGLKEGRIIDPVILSPSDGPLRAQYERRGIAVRIVQSPLADVHDVTTLAGRLQQLAGLYRELGTEVVYGNTLQTFWGIKAADLANLPSVWNVRESEPWQTYFDWLPQDIREIAYDCFSLPYRVVFVASTTRRAWAPVESAYNFTVIPNGLDTERLKHALARVNRDDIRREYSIAADDVAAVLVGTVCERKGQQDLVEALHILEAGAASRIRALIVGDRESLYSQQLHALAQQLPPALRQRLTIVPETSDVPKFLKAADIGLCTSRVESYPRVVLEAMAAGLPIVTTPVFGISEQVRENVNALYYEPGNAPALAQALGRLVNDDSLRARMSAASLPVLEGLVAYPEMLHRYGEIFREARESIGHPWRATAQKP
jgi:GT2 family glycosyltransferase